MISQAGIQPSTINHSANLLLPSELPKIPVFPTFPCHQTRPNKIKHELLKISASYSSPTPKASILDKSIDRDQTKGKRGVEVKPIEKPRLVLKFIWMEKNIGIALDQAIAGGYGTVPLSPYYFWPRTDAWEELKVLLESKPWISQKLMVVLLNQATDVINLWQQSGGNLS